MLRSNNMARAPGRAFSSTYARLEKAAIAAARRNDAMLLYVPDNLAGVYQDSTGRSAAIVGSPIGFLMDRQHGSARGAELVTNGNFSSDLSGWWEVSTAPATVTWVTGTAQFSRIDSNNARLDQVLATVVGATYEISAVITGNAINVTIGTVQGASDVLTFTSFSSALQKVTFVAASATSWIRFVTGSVGTTAVDSVSVKEIKGYHGKQPTAANKPTLTRIPRKRGPELVLNGAFDSAPTGWAGYNGSLAVVSGRLRLTEDADGFGVRAKYLLNTVAGKTYQVLADGIAGTGPLLVVAVANGDTTAYGTNLGRSDRSTSGRLVFTFTAAGAVTSLIVSAPAADGQIGEFDNISVAEVLEWSNVIQADGVDDYLSCTQGNGPAGTFVFAGACYDSSFPSAVVGSGASSNPVAGVCLRANDVASWQLVVGDGVSRDVRALTVASVANPIVVTATWNGTSISMRGAGGTVFSSPSTRNPTTSSLIAIGSHAAATATNVYQGYSALLCSSANVMPDADRKAIERFASYLIGEPYA